MKSIRYILVLLCLAGCAGPQLKRCSKPVEDESIWSCPENVSGEYWKCQKPQNLYVCQDPQ